jgi:hypothetical protein
MTDTDRAQSAPRPDGSYVALSSYAALIEAQRKLIDDQAATIARLMGMNADLLRLVQHLEVCTRIDPRLLAGEAPEHVRH